MWLSDKIGSPPEPVLGSWLNAAFYFADNLLEVQETFSNFHDGIIVSWAKETVNSKTIAVSLANIKRDCRDLPRFISKL